MRSLIEVCKRYEESGVRFLRAAELIRGDDIRVEMIKHLHPRIEKILATQEGMTALVNSLAYNHTTRDALRAALDVAADETFAVADEIIAILSQLDSPVLA